MYQLVAAQTLESSVRRVAAINLSGVRNPWNICTFKTCAIRGTSVVTGAQKSTLITPPNKDDQIRHTASSTNASADSAVNHPTPQQSAREQRKLKRIAAGLYKPQQPGNEGKEVEKRNRTTGQAHISTEQTKRTSRVSDRTKDRRGAQSAGTKGPTIKGREGTLKREAWKDHKAALNEKFGDLGWQPRKRLSPDTLEGIRSLHASDQETYSTQVLSQHFQISPEAIRRILKSKWKPDEKAVEDRRKRWENRGLRKWKEMAGHGVKAPSKWRALGVQAAQKPDGTKKPRAATVKWDKIVSNDQGAGSLARRLL